MLRLESIPSGGGYAPQAVLRGAVIAEEGSSTSTTEPTEFAVVDWALDHSMPSDASAQDAIWILAADAWISLVDPSEAYEATWQATLTAVRLVLLAREQLGSATRLEEVTAAVDAAATALQTESGPRGKRKRHVSHDMRTFAAGQLRAGIRTAQRQAAKLKSTSSRKRKAGGE